MVKIFIQKNPQIVGEYVYSNYTIVEADCDSRGIHIHIKGNLPNGERSHCYVTCNPGEFAIAQKVIDL